MPFTGLANRLALARDQRTTRSYSRPLANAVVSASRFDPRIGFHCAKECVAKF